MFTMGSSCHFEKERMCVSIGEQKSGSLPLAAVVQYTFLFTCRETIVSRGNRPYNTMD